MLRSTGSAIALVLMLGGCATHKPEPGRGAAYRECKAKADAAEVSGNMYFQAGWRASMQDRCMREKGFSTAWF